MAVNIVAVIDDSVKINNVLISVSDKRGLERLVPGLMAACDPLRIYSTGGTYARIKEILGADRSAAGRLLPVSAYTGQPEMQGGLVKTLDYKIYLGLLSETYNPAHADDMARVKAVAIDMVVVNLYPFREIIAAPDATAEMARANIDIGGPCMIRAGAKNYHRVAVVTDPADYDEVLEEMGGAEGSTTLATRFELAKKAFAHTASYDAAISGYLESCSYDDIRGIYTIAGPKEA